LIVQALKSKGRGLDRAPNSGTSKRHENDAPSRADQARQLCHFHGADVDLEVLSSAQKLLNVANADITNVKISHRWAVAV